MSNRVKIYLFVALGIFCLSLPLLLIITLVIMNISIESIPYRIGELFIPIAFTICLLIISVSYLGFKYCVSNIYKHIYVRNEHERINDMEKS